MPDENAVGLEDAAIAVTIGSVVHDVLNGISAWRPIPGALMAWLAPALSVVLTALVYTASALASGQQVPIPKIVALALGSYGKSQQSYVVSRRRRKAKEVQAESEGSEVRDQGPVVSVVRVPVVSAGASKGKGEEEEELWVHLRR